MEELAGERAQPLGASQVRRLSDAAGGLGWGGADGAAEEGSAGFTVVIHSRKCAFSAATRAEFPRILKNHASPARSAIAPNMRPSFEGSAPGARPSSSTTTAAPVGVLTV